VILTTTTKVYSTVTCVLELNNFYSADVNFFTSILGTYDVIFIIHLFCRYFSQSISISWKLNYKVRKVTANSAHFSSCRVLIELHWKKYMPLCSFYCVYRQESHSSSKSIFFDAHLIILCNVLIAILINCRLLVIDR
jgi:hypothetical protein